MCNKCGINEKSGRSGMCKPCKNEYNRSWYEQNKINHKKTVRKNNARYNEAVRALIIEKKSVPCTDCGNSYEYWKMDFDHLPEYTKSFTIGRAGTRSLKTISEEIAKCEVVCKLCHADRTHERRLDTECDILDA